MAPSPPSFPLLFPLLLPLLSLFPSPSTSAVSWLPATATSYGDNLGTTNAGACGFGTLYNSGYGSNTAAISSALFEDGKGCGLCFEVMCDASRIKGHDNGEGLCVKPGKSVVVTATNFCPSSPMGWCNHPNKHFAIAEIAFSQITKYSAQPVPVVYRRVACTRQGGMQFTIDGNSQYNMVLLTNVGGSGSVKEVLVKGSAMKDWVPLMRVWGSNWKTPMDLRGQELSFKVVLSDGTVVVSSDVAPASWQLGQTFRGSQAP